MGAVCCRRGASTSCARLTLLQGRSLSRAFAVDRKSMRYQVDTLCLSCGIDLAGIAG